MGTIQIGSAVAESGKRGNGFLDIASTPDGLPVRTPVVILNGSKPGPRLWVQGCIHGNEYCGALGILQTCREVNPTEMAGALIGFPALNFTAFLEERRFSPYSYFGVPDLNRVFPGKANGNFTEIMAYRIFNAFLKNGDYLIDFHGGHNPDTYWTLYNEDGSDTAKKSQDMAKAFGIDLIYPSTVEILQNGMFAQATKHRIPGIIVEAGGSGELATSEAVTTVSEGIKSVMKYLKILDKPFSWKERYVLFKDWTWMMAPHGGRFAPEVKPRDEIKKGQNIARVYTIFDEELEPVRSSVDGIVLTITRKPFVVAGDSIIQIGIP
jgi:uncharacterized protein